MSYDGHLIRFFRGSEKLGQAESEPDLNIIDIAEMANVEIPTNCTSGTCGTCLVRLVSGSVDIPEELPPGLDSFLVEEGGILTCCMKPTGSCDIDVIPPI